VRVVALTNRLLQDMVRDKTFRGDLYYRLNVFPIQVPPLRRRPEDILELARHFLATLQPRLGRRFAGFDRAAENLLLGYAWPGNVRELRNVIERAMVLERGELLTPRSLVLDWSEAPPEAGAEVAAPAALPGGVVPLEQLEREMVSRAMRAAGDNQTRAAELLEITRDQLRYRLKKFGMRAEDD
jgi:transcriptional regulator with GAF, ATPase, and Fis domain